MQPELAGRFTLSFENRASIETAAGAYRTALLLCLVLVCALAGNMTFPALIPLFVAEWGISNGEAGWVAGMGFLAYALVAPLAVAATDRVDARAVVACGLALSGLAGIGFALTASGFWSALWWRVLTGVGMALSYMPGLKALTDRCAGPEKGRLQSFYTAAYSVGMAASMFQAGSVADLFGWPWAFAISGSLPLLGLVVLLSSVAAHRPAASERRLFDFHPVLRQRVAMRYVLAYAGHCWELFGFRTWLTAFLAFAGAAAAPTPGMLGLVATLVLLIGLPASILGNELASRGSRVRWLRGFMLASAALGVLTGLAGGLPFWVVIAACLTYGAFVMLDSAALTVGTLGAVRPQLTGSTIAVQTLAGSTAAMLAPLLTGTLLDGFGGGGTAWAVVFTVIALGSLLGMAALPREGETAP